MKKSNSKKTLFKIIGIAILIISLILIFNKNLPRKLYKKLMSNQSEKELVLEKENKNLIQERDSILISNKSDSLRIAKRIDLIIKKRDSIELDLQMAKNRNDYYENFIINYPGDPDERFIIFSNNIRGPIPGKD
jgi:hypothetical protein